MKLKYGFILAWASLILAWPVAAQESVTFVPFGATWKYLDTGVDQGTNWVAPDFDDATWLSGPAQLGYGDGDEATVINGGPAGSRIPTSYFRHAFNVDEASTVVSLDLSVRRDDGIIVYLNGTEVFRDNLPDGPISFNDYTFSNAGDDGNAILTGVVSPEWLVDGVNVLAAEVHQDNGNSSDVSFDLQLTAVIAEGPPIIIAQPEPVTVFENSEASFTVVAAGVEPLRYQWDVNGLPIPDATNATLVISMVSTNDAGIYRVVVQNDEGTAVSAKVGLTVLDAGSGLSDDFEPDIDSLQWQAFGGQVLATNYGGSVSGVNSLWFGAGPERFATTRPLNTSSGGTIGFQIRFADGSGDTWETADLPGEGVVLEYSNDGGVGWNEIGVFDSPNLTQWTPQLVPIPADAQGPAVSIRWRQLSFSGDTFDHWAMDDVQVLVGPSAPSIFNQPSDITSPLGGTAVFEVTASGSTPLIYQWFFNGATVDHGTNRTLRLENVSTNDAGSYQVLVQNSLGTVLSLPGELTVVEVEAQLFQIVNLSTNGAVAIEHGEVSQDDHGGIAVSSTHVIYNGQNSIGRFDLNNLANGTDLGVQYDAMISDLQSGAVYTLANGNNPIQTDGGTVNALLEINTQNGALTGTRIDLSTPIFVPAFFSGTVGFFSGFGQAAIYNGERAYVIYLPDGTVLDFGAMPSFFAAQCENGGMWGVVEQHDTALYLAYVENSAAIVRRRVPDGAVEDILRLPNFPNLSDMCAFTVSPFLSRWYFHHEGTSVFRSGDETIGFANATLLFDLPDTPPRILDEPEDVTAVEGLDISFEVRVFGSRPLSYQWHFNGAPIAGAEDDSLDLAAVTPDQSGDYQVVVANEFGSVTSRVATASITLSRGRIGYFSDGVGLVIPDFSPSIVQASFTPVPITNLVSFDLGTVDMLMVYEQGFWPGSALQARMADIETWVNRGGKVMVHDVILAYTSPAANRLMFGAPETKMMSAFSDDINLVLPAALELIVGPHGTFGGSDLDNAGPSTTGHVIRETLPAGASVFFSSGPNSTHIASLAYGLGEGFVYFSTIPIGVILTGTAPNAGIFREVYLPNLIEYMDERVATGAPVMGSEPVDQFVLEGARVDFHAGVRGGAPLDLQWYFNGTALPGATDPILVLPTASVADTGDYQLVAANASGSVTSRLARLTVRSPEGEAFQILNFTSNGVQTVEVGPLINDNRGTLAVSASQVFYTGDGLNGGGETVRLRVTDLTQSVSLGLRYEAMVSDLRTEKVYVLADGDLPLSDFGGVFSTLLEVDENTGAMTTNRIDLSSEIIVPGGSLPSVVGVFSGFGRMLLHNGTRAYHISLPGGEVSDAGAMPGPVHNLTESWAYSGIAEFFGGELYMVYVRNSLEIARTRVPDGMTTAITQFSNLGSMAAIGISPTLRRWYFHYEGTSQFGGGTETIGFADVELDVVEPVGPPEIRANPADRNAYAGRDVTFQSRAVGTRPLSYQWQYQGADIDGATNDTLSLTGVTEESSGEYRVVVTNSLGTATSPPARLVVIRPTPFRIASLLTSNSRVIDHNNLTGDDRGAIAVSSTQVFYTGDNQTARYSAADLSGGAVAGSDGYDSLIGELGTETVYTFANGNQPFEYQNQTGTPSHSEVTSLIALDGSGGLSSTRIDFSRPIPIPLFEPLGFFAGVGRVVLRVGERVYSVELPSGIVFDLGSVAVDSWQGTENWGFGSFWGVAEMIEGVVHLAYVGFDPMNFTPAILRTSVEDGATEVISQFANLSDMAVFTVSLSRNRWYFHYEGNGQFGGTSETLGYADAAFEFDRSPEFGPLPLLRMMNEDASTGPINFTVTDDTTPPDRLVVRGYSNTPDLLPTNNIVVGGTGPGFTVEATAAPDVFGLVRLTLEATDEGGNSSSREIVLSIRSVNDAPTFSKGMDLEVPDTAGPQVFPGWASNIAPGPANESDQTVEFQLQIDNEDLFDTLPAIDGAGTLTFEPRPGSQGTAVVTASLQDSGGTSGGGVNLSAPAEFQIRVTMASRLSINSIERNAEGIVRLVFTGQPGQPYEVRAGESLDDWTSLGVSTELSDGLYEFIDADSPGHDVRFYQIVLP